MGMRSLDSSKALGSAFLVRDTILSIIYCVTVVGISTDGKLQNQTNQEQERSTMLRQSFDNSPDR